MILLWGLDTDPPLRAVRNALDRLGKEYFLLDQRTVLRTEVDLVAECAVTGSVRCDGRMVRLEDVSAFYMRPDDIRKIVDLADASLLRHALEVEDLLLSWSEITPALVINRPSAMGSNSSKPYQVELIRALGFSAPETLATTDADAVLEFWKQHGEIIYKSVSGVRSIVSRMTCQHIQRLADVGTCPTQFQEYVPGVDCRVHVAGDMVFACEVHSSTDDYRYGHNEVKPCDVPQFVAEHSKAIAAALGLTVAGLDLRRTPEGQWYCFEVNPSPGFTFYDRLEGEPIATAIASILASRCPVTELTGSIYQQAHR